MLPTKSGDGICREPEFGPSFSEDKEFLQLKSFTDEEAVSGQA